MCYGLIIALLSTIAPVPFAAPASAQLMPTYSVGVVEFLNESGVQGQLLARLATDAVVVEMSKTNRYDVSITRSMIKSEMEKLDLHPPLTKIGLVRLGEALSADAMLEGSIKSVQLAGSGVTRRASVTMVVQMVDQASGEIINGAVQTGTSSARVGYTPDDDTLITEAINNAAFLVVKTMVDYIVPEATVLMNVGEDQVMLNKGARDGLKPGMRMIVLRQKEIIGYIELREVGAADSMAKVTKSLRGIQPQDKARAIFEMPTVSGSAKTQPLPSGAPSSGGGSRSALSKIGKFLLGAAVVFGIFSIFNSGRGNEDAPHSGALETTDGIPGIKWDPGALGHGKSVVETQILRVDSAGAPVMGLRDPSAWDRGYTKITAPDGGSLFGTGVDTAVSYYRLDANPASSYTETTVTVPAEPFGVTHTYQIRVLYQITTVAPDGTLITKYYYSETGAPVVATAIEPVKNTDVVMPAYDPSFGPTELLISDLLQGKMNFQWQRKDGANVYYMSVEPVVPTSGTAVWRSTNLYETGPTITVSVDQRNSLANWLANTFSAGTIMRWRVYCRHEGDTSLSWAMGEENRFVIGEMPPGTP